MNGRSLTKEKSWSKAERQLKREFVGVDFNFSQYIQDNMEEAVSGVKGENCEKFGRDLAGLERLSKSVKQSPDRRGGTNRRSICSASPICDQDRPRGGARSRSPTSTRSCRRRSAARR
jgi:hypothetical protein